MTYNNDKNILRLFFSPATALLSRMSYSRKFALLWLMSLLAVAIAVQPVYQP